MRFVDKKNRKKETKQKKNGEEVEKLAVLVFV